MKSLISFVLFTLASAGAAALIVLALDPACGPTGTEQAACLRELADSVRR